MIAATTCTALASRPFETMQPNGGCGNRRGCDVAHPIAGGDLRTVTVTKSLHEQGSAIGVDRGACPCPADGDIGGAGINSIGAERFQMGDDALAG